MPISPQEIAHKRVEFSVNKLTEIIDKKLKEHFDDTPFEFHFNNNTDPHVKDCISTVYQQVGWNVIVDNKDDHYVLTLKEPGRNYASPVVEAPNEEATPTDVAAVAPDTKLRLGSMIKKPETSYADQREDIMRSAFDHPEGRAALAQAMVEPIRNSLMYQSVSRKLFMVDELPQAALARYDLADEMTPIYYSHGEIKPYNNSDECIKDFTDISALATIDLSEIRERRFYIVDRAQVKLKDSIQRQEDIILFKLLDVAATHEQTIYTYVETIKRALNDSFIAIEEQEIIAAKVVMSPKTFRKIRDYLYGDLDDACQRDILMTGLYGHLWSADIHISTIIEDGDIYVLPPAQFLGAYAIKQDITVLPCDEPQNQKLGWLATTSVLPVILNNKFVRKIKIRF